MMKRKKLTTLLAVMLLVCTLASVFPQRTLAADSSVSLSDWMATMPDTAPISQLNIPGTHDSGTHWLPEIISAYMGNTQVKSIPEQLENGIRVFDIRLDFPTESIFYSTDYRDLCVVHGPLACYLDEPLGTRLRFTHVTEMCEDFLDEHPTETVILKLQAESTLFSNSSVEAAIESFRWVITDRYIYCNRADSVQRVPTMGQARGKIILMTAIGGETSTKYEDHYDVDADVKKADLKKCFDESALQSYVFEDTLWPKFIGDSKRNEEGYEGEPAIKLVFTSTNLVYLGPIILSIPINNWVEKYEFQRGTRYGWVLMDFPTTKMVRKIIDSNAGSAELLLNVDWSQTTPGIGRFRVWEITLFRENSTHTRTKVKDREMIVPEDAIAVDENTDLFVYSGLAIADENGEDWYYSIDLDYFAPMYWTYDCTNEEINPPENEQRTARRIHADIVMDPKGYYGTINASMYDYDTGELLGHPEVLWNEGSVFNIYPDYTETPSEQLDVGRFIDSDYYKVMQLSANNVTVGVDYFPTFSLNKNSETDMIIRVRAVDRYNVTVYGGESSQETAKLDDEITVKASPASEGMEFAYWEVLSGDVTLDNPYSEITFFTMPAESVELEAVFTELPPEVEITELVIGLTEPAPGNTPETNPILYTVPADSILPCRASWYRLPATDDPNAADAAWEEMPDDSVFETGYYYAVELSCIPKDGYAFSNTLSGSVNGHPNCIAGVGAPDKYRVKLAFVFDPPAETYTITVTDGTAYPAEATAGTEITLTSDNAPEGQEFDRWEVLSGDVTLDDATAPDTTFVMPESNVEVKATYKEIVVPPAKEYAVTVTNGAATPEKATAGTEIALTADEAPEGKEFDRWEVLSGDATLADATLPDTTFVMPEGDVEVKAVYKDITVPPAPAPEYKITDGDGQRYTKKSGKDLKFTGSGEPRLFIGIEIDGTAVASKNYRVGKDTMTVTLLADYLSSLPTGKHTVRFIFEDGKSDTAEFTIKAEKSDNEDPSTGDESRPALWLALAAVSAAGVIVLTKKRRA